MTGFPLEGVVLIALAAAFLIWVIWRTRQNRINSAQPKTHSNAHRGEGHNQTKLNQVDTGNGGV